MVYKVKDLLEHEVLSYLLSSYMKRMELYWNRCPLAYQSLNHLLKVETKKAAISRVSSSNKIPPVYRMKIHI